MNIIISNSSGQPIYEQIVSQIKNQILTKELTAGEALPSMRVLAKELKVSVITTKRAYEELEKEGLIESYTGKGSFIKAQNEQQVREQYLHDIKLKLKEVVEISKLAKLDLSTIIDMLKTMQKGD